MAEHELPPAPDDPLQWAPMRAYAGRRKFDIVDPVLEPLWNGTRVLVHFAIEREAEPPVTVRLVEELGAELSEELPDLTKAIGESILAHEAIVDGVISRQLTLDGVGAAAIPEVRSRLTEVFLRGNLDLDVQARGVIEDRVNETEAVDGFMAVDLLRVDGASLLDVPLLERKRLLESVIAPSPLVRLSTHVRPPIDPWLATWKSMGLSGGILKATNSRYRPSDDSIEWRVVKSLHGRR